MSTRSEKHRLQAVLRSTSLAILLREPVRLAAAAIVLWVLVAWPASTRAGTLLDASYAAGDNELVVEIAYQGTNPDHQFVLEWGACQRNADGGLGAVARLIDSDGHDVAREEFRVWRRFNLSGLDCRPADVTVRLGPVSNRTVYIPPAPRP